jgi:proline racemase
MTSATRELTVLDYHTEGEPMRIVVDGVPPVPGPSLMARSEWLAANGRELMGFILYEPRGHAAMCAAILTEPVNPAAQVGVLFIEPLGPVHMCGHGTIAVATMLVETGRVAVREPETTVTLETPAGLVSCRVRLEGGRVAEATFRNVPAFSVRLDEAVEVDGLGRVPFDLAYGGHFYALVPAAAVGLILEPASGARIIEVGERIRARIEAEVPLVHPGMPAARGLLYIQFYEPARRPDAQLRNAVVVAPAGLDRSPCGTGTSARLANLHARGALAVGEPFGHESIIGSLFVGRIAELATLGGRPAIVPEITGRAWAMGRATLLLDPRDPYPAGFLV